MLDALVAEARLRWGLDLAAGLQVVAPERLTPGIMEMHCARPTPMTLPRGISETGA